MGIDLFPNGMADGNDTDLTRRTALRRAATGLAGGAALAGSAGTAAAATTIPVHIYYRPGTYSAYADAPDAVDALSEQVDFTAEPRSEGSYDEYWDGTLGGFEDWVESNENPQDGHVYVLINEDTSLEGSLISSDDPAYCLVDENPASDFDQDDTFHNMVIHEVAHVLGMNELDFQGHTAGGITESTYVHYKTPMLTTYDATDCNNSVTNCWTEDDLCVAASDEANGLTDYLTTCTRDQLNGYVDDEFSSGGWW